jgi:hypothetical protein
MGPSHPVLERAEDVLDGALAYVMAVGGINIMA